MGAEYLDIKMDPICNKFRKEASHHFPFWPIRYPNLIDAIYGEHLPAHFLGFCRVIGHEFQGD